MVFHHVGYTKLRQDCRLSYSPAFIRSSESKVDVNGVAVAVAHGQNFALVRALTTGDPYFVSHGNRC